MGLSQKGVFWFAVLGSKEILAVGDTGELGAFVFVGLVGGENVDVLEKREACDVSVAKIIYSGESFNFQPLSNENDTDDSDSDQKPTSKIEKSPAAKPREP